MPLNRSSSASLRRRRLRGQRGISMALLLTMLIIFAIIAGGVMSMVSTCIRGSQKRIDQVEAFNMADSGIDLALAWLIQQSSPPDDTTLRNMTNFFGTNGTINAPFGQTGTSLTVKIYGDTSNPGPTQKKYLIEAKSIMPSGASQIVRAYVQQVSFGKYAYFTVNDGGGFWDYNNHFEGPFHSNDADGKASMFPWKSNPSGGPIFTYTGADAFSVSGNPTWWKDTINHVQAPSSTADYNSIAAGGKATMTYGYKTDTQGNAILDSKGNKIANSPVIPLPTTDYAQQWEALGLTPPNPCNSPSSSAPSTGGATLYSNGGIYIHGDSSVAFSLDLSGNQVITVTSATTSGSFAGTKTQTIVMSKSGKSTTMTTVAVYTGKGAPGTTTTTNTVNSLPNGLVYSDGNITSFSGTVADNTVDGAGNITYRNSWTVATDVAAGKSVTVTGSVKYNTARNLAVAQALDTNFNQRAGTIGILSKDVILKDGTPAQVEIDGSIFCTGSFYAANTNNPPASSNGVMTCIGGVIVHDAGLFAKADSSGNLVSGWNEQYHYDQRLGNYPPPYFPTTGSHYDLVSWQNVSATIQ